MVLTGAEATKILFKPKSEKKAPRIAEAVEFVSGGKKYQVKAKREVIVSTGTSSLLQHCPVLDRWGFDARYLFFFFFFG